MHHQVAVPTDVVVRQATNNLDLQSCEVDISFFNRELPNRRLLHAATVRLRDMLTAHAFLSTCQRRAKGDVGESDSTSSPGPSP